MARTARASDVERMALVLLYHPATGAIVHAHYAAADPGAELPGRPVIEREALDFAKRRRARRGGVAVEKLGRLHVDPRRFRADRVYRVDVSRRVLIPAGRRPSSSRRAR